MIELINLKLERWATWLRTGRTRLGYPSQSAFVGAMGGGRAQAPQLPDEEAMVISRLVNGLDEKLRETVKCYYYYMPSCTVEEMAKQLGCAPRTVYDRLDMAHRRIQGFFDVNEGESDGRSHNNQHHKQLVGTESMGSAATVS